MAMGVWYNIQGYVLLPLGVLLHALWETLGHPIETFYVLISIFGDNLYTPGVDFRLNRYCGLLTRTRMQTILRMDLVQEYNATKDAMVYALCQAVGRWHRWNRGPMHALFHEFAVEVVEATTGRKTKVWTQDRFAAFVASRLGGDDSGVVPILWRSFCYSSIYPFTLSLVEYPAEDWQLDLAAWVQAVALLATNTVDGIDYSMEAYPATGLTIWYQFFSFAVRSGAPHRPRSNNATSGDNGAAQSVLEQVAYVASNQLHLEYGMRGPDLTELLPRVRKLVNDAECEPLSTTDFAIPYHDMVCLFAAVLQVNKPDIFAARPSMRLEDNLGLSLAADIDRATHLVVARAILAVAGVHEDNHGNSTVSYKQYDALRNILHTKTDNDRHEHWLFDHELGLFWRSLFSVFPINNLEGLTHNSLGIDETPEHPLPTLISQALNFLYPLVTDGWTRWQRRKNGLNYTSEAGWSWDGILAALTNPYYSRLILLYGRTIDDNPQPAIFVVSMSTPLWCTYDIDRTDDYFVDDQHLLMEIAPRARFLQYQPTKNTKTTYADLVEVDNTTNAIFFGRRPGLCLHVGAGVAHLSAAPQMPGHYAEIPAGPHTKNPEPLASPVAWTTSMTITKLEVYGAPAWAYQDLAIMRGLRRSSRLQAAAERGL